MSYARTISRIPKISYTTIRSSSTPSTMSRALHNAEYFAASAVARAAAGSAEHPCRRLVRTS
jgi:hypothetical protein